MFACLVVGCSSTPTSKQAATFGTSATAALELVKDARAVEADLGRERSIERYACNFLRGGKIVLAAKPEGKFSPVLVEQIQLLDAISNYADALSKATDPEIAAKLEASAATLSDSVVTLAGSLPAASASPIIGPAVKLISTVAVDVIELETRARLREVITRTDPFLRTAAAKLLEDLATVEIDTARSFAQWKAARACSLEALRSDIRTPAHRLYTSYKDADAVGRQFHQRSLALAQRGEILGALLRAHYDLISDEVDLDATLQKLKDIVQRLNALKKVLTPSSSDS